VIRSGGANVMSNFLPLQSAYARLYFFDALFNALEWADIERCLSEYRGLDRKYGN
jgi:undecaprenyl diphosphate synthase